MPCDLAWYCALCITKALEEAGGHLGQVETTYWRVTVCIHVEMYDGENTPWSERIVKRQKVVVMVVDMCYILHILL